MVTYLELKKRHQAEVNAFPMFFAYSQKQLEEGMRELGLAPSQTNQIYRFGDTGGYYRKSDAPALHEMFDRHERERQEAIAADTTGDGYILEMFRCELADHEYNYTRDETEALESLGLTMEEVVADPRLRHGFEKACRLVCREEL